MAAIRTYTNWNQRSSDNEEKIEPLRKYFFICEGANTEVWYFKKLIDLRKQLGINPLIDIRLMEKTDEDRNISNPKALISFAEKQKKTPANGFDAKHDRMVIVFDADIYAKKPDTYEEILELGSPNNILAVTNPSFELFLLLHYENSLDEIILPHKHEILENRKIGKQRCITVLFRKKSGKNPKENPGIGDLAEDIDIAIDQESRINADIREAIGKITSNVGSIIKQIREDKIEMYK